MSKTRFQNMTHVPLLNPKRTWLKSDLQLFKIYLLTGSADVTDMNRPRLS